jgi:hypothetical protein
MKYLSNYTEAKQTEAKQEGGTMNTQPRWPGHVKTAYSAFKNEREQFNVLMETLPSNAIVKASLKKLEAVEHQVWVAWAECTTDVNPGMLAELERTKPKALYPKICETLDAL